MLRGGAKKRRNPKKFSFLYGCGESGAIGVGVRSRRLEK